MTDSENLEGLYETKDTLNIGKHGSCNTKEKRTSYLAVGSLICACLGILLSYGFLYAFTRLHPTYRGLKGVSIALLAGGSALSVISLIVISVNRERLKGSMFAVISLLICVLPPIMWYPVETSIVRHRRSVISSKLTKLYRSITEYSADNDGYLPAADKWCDLLMEHNRNLSKETFKYPTGKYGIFIFAFNNNLNGLRLDDIPNDVVLIFEHDRISETENKNGMYWNLAAGDELVKNRLKKKGEEGRFFVLEAGGRIYQSVPSLRKLFNEQLRWQP